MNTLELEIYIINLTRWSEHDPECWLYRSQDLNIGSETIMGRCYRLVKFSTHFCLILSLWANYILWLYIRAGARTIRLASSTDRYEEAAQNYMY